MKKRVISSLVALGLGSLSGSVLALNVSGSVGAGLEHSDNITESANDERSDTIRTVDADVVMEHTGDRVQGSLNYNVARDDYAQNVYGNQTVTNGSAQLNIELVDDTLNWLTSNTTSYDQVSSAEADTPDNSTNQNIFSTGPQWILRLGQVDALTLADMYQDVTFDNGVNSDNTRNNATVDWTHYLADQRRVLAGVMRSSVKYQNNTLPNGARSDYDMDRYYVGYASEAGHLTYDFMIGRDKAKPDVGKDTNGDFRQINVGYTLNEHSLTASYNKEITDTTMGLSANNSFDNVVLNTNPMGLPQPVNTLDQTGIDVNTGDSNYQLAELVENTNKTLTYSSPVYSGFSGYVTAYQNTQDYQISSGDEKITGYVVALNYQVVESLKLTLSYGEETTNFSNSLDLGEDEETTTRLNANYSLSPQWNILGWIEHINQDNTTVAANNFDENLVAVGLRYNFD